MSRRSRDAELAAQQASEAARVLQQRGQEVKSEKVDPTVEDKTPDSPGVKVVTPRNEPRRRAMEEIEARDLQTKGMDAPGIQPAPEPEKVEDPAPPTPEQMLQGGKHSQPEPEQPKEPEAKVEAPKEPEKPKTVRVKVDGEEFDAPLEEVESAGGVKAYQIEKASENRLKKAQEALAEAKRVEARLLELAKQKEPEKPKETDSQFIASKVDAIRFGTPEELSNALQEIVQRLNKPVDQNVLVQQAIEKFNHDQAVREFDKEFTDVVSNPMALKLTVALRNERMAKLEGPTDWNSFYRTIGNEVRSAFGRPSQSASVLKEASKEETGTPSPASEKEARKASIVNLPTAATRAEVKEAKPETREDILNEMRKKRGIPTG